MHPSKRAPRRIERRVVDAAMCRTENRRLADQLIDASTKGTEILCGAHGLTDRIKGIVVIRANALDFRERPIQRCAHLSNRLTRSFAWLDRQTFAWSGCTLNEKIREVTAALVELIC
jgi:hypothetical protein